MIHKIKGNDEKNYSEEDCRKLDLNMIAMNFLHHGMNESDFNRTYTCKTAKEIWNELKKKNI